MEITPRVPVAVGNLLEKIPCAKAEEKLHIGPCQSDYLDCFFFFQSLDLPCLTPNA